MQSCPVCATVVQGHETVCPACGFRLAGSTQQFSRIDMSSVQELAPAKAVSTARLRVVNGPQVHSVHEIKGERATIGRKPSCDVFLNDMTVSRLHATVFCVDGAYYICDENSFNGTWVNNCIVDKRELRAGDLIQLGKFCLVFEVE